MTTTPEKKVKLRIQQILKELQCYYAMPIGTGYGNSGTPDFLICLNGLFIAIEAKAGKGRPTELQKKHLREIEAAGGLALIVNEENLDGLKNKLQEWARREWQAY